MALSEDVPRLRRASAKRGSRANAVAAANGERDVGTITLRPAKDWTPSEKEAVCMWLCHEKYNELRGQAARMLGDYHAAKDVTQGFLMGLVASAGKLSQFDPAKSQFWPTYIKACFTNFTVEEGNRIRDQNARTTQLDETDHVVPPTYDTTWLGERFGVPRPASARELLAVEATVEHERCRTFMRDCFATLEASEQKAFYLVEFEGWRSSQLAVEFGDTAATWRKRLQRARDKMKACVTHKYQLRWKLESRKTSRSPSRDRK